MILFLYSKVDDEFPQKTHWKYLIAEVLKADPFFKFSKIFLAKHSPTVFCNIIFFLPAKCPAINSLLCSINECNNMYAYIVLG